MSNKVLGRFDTTSGPISALLSSRATDSNLHRGGRHGGRGIPASIPSSQRYIWSSLWRQGEMESDADLARGDVERFANPLDAVRWLLSEAEDEG